MAYYEQFDQFSVYFNMMKMKYTDFDESLTSKRFLEPHDKLNVFINMESILKLLTMIPELDRKLRLNRDFCTIITSNTLNLAGHYKRFFVNNGLDTRIYFYSTDLTSDYFPQMKYNEDYRSYYLVKYNDNPKFTYFTDLFKDTILPDIKTYCDFIPRVYYLESKNIDASIIPYVVAEEDRSRKNIIISGELFESQYAALPGFLSYVISIGGGAVNVTSSIDQYLQRMTKKEATDIKELIALYSASHSMYVSLLSVLEDRTRSVSGLNGVGPRTLERYLYQGIERNEITLNTKSPEIIGDIFHDSELKSDFVNNFYCTSVLEMYKEMTGADIVTLLNRRKDRYDNNSLQTLNNTVFQKYKLTLEALCL